MMQKYQKTYFTQMGFTDEEIHTYRIPSELDATLQANSIHHIHVWKNSDRQNYPIEYLMALTQGQHEFYGDKKQWYDYLIWMHIVNMSARKAVFSYLLYPQDIAPTLLDARHTDYFKFWSNVYLKGYAVMFKETTNGVLMNVYKDEKLLWTKESETKEQLIMAGI